MAKQAVRLLKFPVFSTFGTAVKILVRVVAGERLKIVYKMRLVVIAVFVRNFRKRFAAVAVLLQRALEADDTGKQFGAEACHFLEPALKLPGGKTEGLRQLPHGNIAFGGHDVLNGLQRGIVQQGMLQQLFFEKCRDDVAAFPVVFCCQHALFQLQAFAAKGFLQGRHLVAECAGRQAKQAGQGKRIKIHTKNAEAFCCCKTFVHARLPMHKATAVHQRNTRCKRFEYAFVMKHHFG